MLTETSEWIMIIGNLGFPIAITIYLFIRFEKRIENLEQSINYLSEVIQKLGKGVEINATRIHCPCRKIKI